MVTPQVHLGIGEIYIGETATIVDTILGSCVSVCIFSVHKKVGGIIHYALPDRSYASETQRNELHFGDLAIHSLVQKIRSLLGDSKTPLQAKIVGGGRVIDHIHHSDSIGDLNIQVAEKTLATLNIPVIGKNVGGDHGRKIYFYTDSGRLRVSALENHRTRAKSLPRPPVFLTKTKVFVVDDSKTIREMLSKILSGPEMEVIGTAANPVEAEPLILKLKPDVITLDISMPLMDGVTFLERFLPKNSYPVVMISSISMEESNLVLRALEIGAVDYIQKPTFSDLQTQAEVIREKVLMASKIKVQRKAIAPETSKKTFAKTPSSHDGSKIFFFGASTGGTEALKEVLVRLPADIPPILVVQHIPPVFSTAFANRLNELCPFEVKEAQDGDLVLPGRVLIAPGDYQMELQKKAGQFSVRVFAGEKTNRHRPSVDVLFNSAADLVGPNAIGLILTGMGEDGAKGLLKMRQAGARTLTQDESTCVVYGMPKAAVEIGASEEAHPLTKIPDILIKRLAQRKSA